MTYIYLDKVDKDDWHRNQPLSELEAEYKNVDSKVWSKIYPNMTIAKKTYNELASIWTTFDEWRCPAVLWDEDRIDVIGSNGNEGLHYE